MPKKISEVERITTYFQTADESAANVMTEVIKGIMAARFGKRKVQKPKPVAAPRPVALDTSTASPGAA